MRVLVLLTLTALLCACAAPHAPQVRCDRHLVPINAPVGAKHGESSSADSAERGNAL